MRAWMIKLYAIVLLISFRAQMQWLKIPVKSHYKVISLGLGQQSTALYLMSCLGDLPRADVAIFADPGAESKETYQHLKHLKRWAKKNHGIPILTVSSGSLYKDLLRGLNTFKKRFASIPVFTKGADGKVGMLRRQCTNEYKTIPINQAIRKLYGKLPRQHLPKTEVWLGITQEEMERMKFPEHGWLTFVYPFLNRVVTKAEVHRHEYGPVQRRSDCQAWLLTHGFKLPPKSACQFCPFQGDDRWLQIKRHQPAEWKRVTTLDKTIRNSSAKGIKQPVYLHRSCVPLEEAELKVDQLDLFASECYGACGT